MISLNCPATPETENLVNAQSIDWMKPGVVFVNTARGCLVDENALIEALSSGHIAAAGLDVFQTEPGGNPAFATCPNVLMLPHLDHQRARLVKQWVIALWIILTPILLDVNHEIDWFNGLRNLV